MSVVVLRGAIRGEQAEGVATEALASLIVFSGIGAMAGWIADQLVRGDVETLFRNRVQWYQKGLADMNRSQDDSGKTD